MKIDEGKHGKTIEVKNGDTFLIRLNENPTTGYRWAIESSGEPLLEIKSDEFTCSPPRLCGSGGMHNWTFVAKEIGTAIIKMEYNRSWEKTSGDPFTLTVNIT